MSQNSPTEPENKDQPQHFVMTAETVVYEGIFGPQQPPQPEDQP